MHSALFSLFTGIPIVSAHFVPERIVHGSEESLSLGINYVQKKSQPWKDFQRQVHHGFSLQFFLGNDGESEVLRTWQTQSRHHSLCPQP